jgi:hypothetical protein
MFLMLPSANTYGGQCTVFLRFKICAAQATYLNSSRNEPEPNKRNQE